MGKANDQDKGEQAADAAGLDISTPPVPGTFMGAHDKQGTDGETRTDRPGALLGTPVTDKDSTDHGDRAKDIADRRATLMADAVDKANREELPKLGGAGDLDAEEASLAADEKAAKKASK